MFIHGAECLDVVVIWTGRDPESMFFGGYVQVVVPVVVLADRAVGVLGVRSREDLDREIVTSWLSF